MARAYRTEILFLCGVVAGLVINSMISDIVIRTLGESYRLHGKKNSTNDRALDDGNVFNPLLVSVRR